MAEERGGDGIRLFVDWMIAGRLEADPLLEEFLAAPPSEWDDWLARREAARSVSFFEGVIEVAEQEPVRALALAGFALRHLHSLDPPPEGELAYTFLHGHAWRVYASALLGAGDRAAALRAFERSASVFRAEPVARPELEAVEQAAAPLRSVAERLLRETPFAEWPGLLRRSKLRDVNALRDLSSEIVARVHRVPRESLVIAEMAVMIADSLPREGREEQMAEARAGAWKDLAITYGYLSRFDDSFAAFDRGAEILEPFDRLTQPRAVLQLARVGTLAEVGRFEEAAALLSECRAVFRDRGDRRRLLLCGMLEGGLLHRTGRYEEAVALYLSVLQEAREFGDLDIVASLHNNAGHALIPLQRFEEADPHLTRAGVLFAELGQPLRQARAQLGRGRMLLSMGDVKRGLAELQAARALFLQEDLVEEAALCGLDIVKAHLKRGASVAAEGFARQIVREFTAARLSARAITALGYLSEAIAAREASVDTVERVSRYIHVLRTQPDAEFAST